MYQVLENAVKWLFASSADPSGVSMTIRGILVGFVAGYKGSPELRAYQRRPGSSERARRWFCEPRPSHPHGHRGSTHPSRCSPQDLEHLVPQLRFLAPVLTRRYRGGCMRARMQPPHILCVESYERSEIRQDNPVRDFSWRLRAGRLPMLPRLADRGLDMTKASARGGLANVLGPSVFTPRR
jgi:hypothetical protein